MFQFFVLHKNFLKKSFLYFLTLIINQSYGPLTLYTTRVASISEVFQDMKVI